MQKVKKVIPYLLILVIDFYVLPVFIKGTGSGMIVLLIIMPLICLVNAIVYGIKQGFHMQIALFAGILFIPSIFIYYNSSAWVYALGYAFIALLGNTAGFFVKKCSTDCENE